jgi:hypothetical protein
VAVEPEEVSALGRGLSLEAPKDGDAGLLETAAQGFFLAAAQGLAHPQQHRAPLGNQDGVEDVDGIRAVRLGRGVPDHLGAGAAQQINEGVVLAPGSLQIDPRGVMPAHGIGVAEGLVRPADEDAAQGSDHGLTAI